ncbi:hypothetical protein M728_000648 [Ensifer sp. WSM1721]|uniref:hypothetical protein n=1 Tax=Ensifer sp. WSM1721 TaxID=1041159 RepID=UPI0004B36DFD|nr:hypothetical protein [Ensifer sp. WSM1721]
MGKKRSRKLKAEDTRDLLDVREHDVDRAWERIDALEGRQARALRALDLVRRILERQT